MAFGVYKYDWAAERQRIQAGRSRDPVYITYNGVRQKQTVWARAIGVGLTTLKKYLYRYASEQEVMAWLHGAGPKPTVFSQSYLRDQRSIETKKRQVLKKRERNRIAYQRSVARAKAAKAAEAEPRAE